MTEALEAVKLYCLNEIKVNRVSGGCAVDNIASKKVMEKCNFDYEGTLRSYIKLSDGYHDMLVYSMINN